MSLTVQALLAVAPILAAGVLLVGLRWPATRVMPLVYAVAAVIALTAWQVTPSHVIASSILVGVTGGLENPALTAQLAEVGWSFSDYLQLITTESALLHGLTGTLMPLLMVVMLTRFYGGNRSWTEGLSIAPFAIFGGLAFTVPYTLTGAFLGPEFPSLLGALIGLGLLSFATRRGFLLPKDTWDFSPRKAWGSDWMGKIDITLKTQTGKTTAMTTAMTTTMAWAPYVLLALLLVLSRLPQLPLGSLLQAWTVAWADIFGTGITGSTQPLYLPGTLMIITVFITYFLHRMKPADLRAAFSESARLLVGAGFVLVFTVPMVRIYINSGINAAALPSMPVAMAEWVAESVGAIWPLFAPTIGATGAFIAGSNTVSNLMFSLFQHSVAESLLISGALVVALQAVGAAAGNMVAIHNVVAASATVGLLGP